MQSTALLSSQMPNCTTYSGIKTYKQKESSLLQKDSFCLYTDNDLFFAENFVYETVGMSPLVHHIEQVTHIETDASCQCTVEEDVA